MAQQQNGLMVIETRLPYDPELQKKFRISPIKWRALVETVWPNAMTAGAVHLALAYCRARKLDPFKKVCHIVPIWNSELNRVVEGVWPGVADHRTTASRTGSYAGMDAPEFGPMVTHTFPAQTVNRKKRVNGAESWYKKTYEAKEIAYPEWCQITVYRIVQGHRVPFVGPKIFWLEYYGRLAHDVAIPNEQWGRRSSYMLEKCFGPETEVLTDHGFQRFDSVTGRILQVGSEGLEPTDVKPFRQNWSGPMVYADGDALNFRVTPNHDMLTLHGKMEAADLLEAASSRPKYRIPLTIDGTRLDARLSDRAILLAAAFSCDGYAAPYGRWCIAASRDYKIQALDEIGGWTSRLWRHSAGDVAHTEVRAITTTKDKIVYTFLEEEFGGLVDLRKTFDRAMLLSLSQRQARLLVDRMILHDGADNGQGTMRFYSSQLAILEAFELAAVIAGYAVSQRRPRTSDIGGPNWSVTISDKPSVAVLRYSPSQIARGDKGGLRYTSSNPDQEVWCCAVPSGVIVVRRRGLSMLCGNCAEAGALRRAYPEELGNEMTVEEIAGVTPDKLVDITPRNPNSEGGDVPDEEPKRADYTKPKTQVTDVDPEPIEFTHYRLTAEFVEFSSHFLGEKNRTIEEAKKWREFYGPELDGMDNSPDPKILDARADLLDRYSMIVSPPTS